VEFAIVSTVFLMLLLGAIEMSRLLWTWNAAVEATRRGARLAVVCDKNDPIIKTKMRQMLPALQDSNITIDYLDPAQAINACDATNCKSVRVSLSGYTHKPIIPFAALSIPIPTFQTALPKEWMQSTGNPVCQ
jgi:hypothetical protein